MGYHWGSEANGYTSAPPLPSLIAYQFFSYVCFNLVFSPLLNGMLICPIGESHHGYLPCKLN